MTEILATATFLEKLNTFLESLLNTLEYKIITINTRHR